MIEETVRTAGAPANPPMYASRLRIRHVPGQCRARVTKYRLRDATVAAPGTRGVSVGRWRRRRDESLTSPATARDASTLDDHTIMVADAIAARRDQDLNATLYTIYR